MHHADQILTAAQIRAAEQALIGAGSSVGALMRIAGQGAAEWVWRLSAGRSVTVLCGPGNNGGDGYVLAEALRQRGGDVRVVAPAEPKTDAAEAARAAYQGEVLGANARVHGEVFVDCLFGTGLTRPLTEDHAALLLRLAAAHTRRIAIDLPSGIDSDTGALLGKGETDESGPDRDWPRYDLTIALGGWKYAHLLMPACARMGALRLLPIGLAPVVQAGTVIAKPRIPAPGAASHKYTRGLLAVVGGAMPGATVLAATAAQGAGAGYVKLFAETRPEVPADMVVDTAPLASVLSDKRIAAVLIGPGLGRDASSRERLGIALAATAPAVVDADALVLLGPRHLAERQAATIATPHEGELARLESAFELKGEGSKVERAGALAKVSGMVVVAKGPDSVVAAPDGRIACARSASSWLSTAGTGDVLAGIIASRLASGAEPFAAACEGVWLHGEAARISGAAFTASDLARRVPAALAQCL